MYLVNSDKKCEKKYYTAVTLTHVYVCSTAWLVHVVKKKCFFFFQKQLLDASKYGDRKTVVLLLEKGVDPNCKDDVSFFCLELEFY